MERLTFEGNFCDIAQCRELPCIEKFTPERVVDIKYSSAINGRSHEHYYSAMVILKDEEDKKDG